MNIFPKVQIGQPLRCESLSVFPLSSDAEATAKYLLEKEAFRSDAIVVKEVNKDGVVWQLTGREPQSFSGAAS